MKIQEESQIKRILRIFRFTSDVEGGMEPYFLVRTSKPNFTPFPTGEGGREGPPILYKYCTNTIQISNTIRVQLHYKYYTNTNKAITKTYLFVQPSREMNRLYLGENIYKNWLLHFQFSSICENNQDGIKMVKTNSSPSSIILIH